MRNRCSYLVVLSCMLWWFASCSTTRNLPEGEQLYTGRQGITIENQDRGPTADAALTEIEAALAKAPNNALFGSSSVRIPFPFGLWMYNKYVHAERGFGKWMFKRFAAQPVFISTVNPDIRAKVATNLLHDYGYFEGTAGYEVITNRRNPRKAGVRYFLDMKTPYCIDTIMIERFPDKMMQLLLKGSEYRPYIRKGDQFNVVNLAAERDRLSSLLRNMGYYYFRPDYIGFLADTTRVHGLVDLKIIKKSGVPEQAQRKFTIGDIAVHLYGVHGEVPNDSVIYDSLTIHYHDKLKVRPKVLKRSFRFKPGQLYSQIRTSLTQERLAELGIFRLSEIQFTPRDTLATNDILDVRVNSVFDLPYDSELELNLAFKSNDYAGPGAAYSITKRNVFRGGETFSIRLNGSYEWETNSSNSSGGRVNSYELGLTASLTYPRILFPRLRKKEYDFPASTKLSVNIDQLNRAHYFKMLSFGGDMTYLFHPTLVSTHSVTPFRLTFNTLQEKTATFNAILENRPSLKVAMENQFIPSMNYTYTYDDLKVRRRRNRFWWQASFTSAGNVTSGIYGLFGKGFSDDKQFMGASLSQFVKLTNEVRYTWNIDRNQSLASRVLAGVIYAYGGRNIAPYSEQYFIGGANSIRAFTVRSIGPGRYVPDTSDKYGYLDQSGDIKFEANLEYRFRIISDLHGAVFFDTGNIWLMRKDAEREGGKFSMSGFPRNLAMGTGAGLRYDLSFLVIRFDCGIGLHVPYETERSGFYNIPSFKDGVGLHFAIGYPF